MSKQQQQQTLYGDNIEAQSVVEKKKFRIQQREKKKQEKSSPVEYNFSGQFCFLFFLVNQ